MPSGLSENAKKTPAGVFFYAGKTCCCVCVRNDALNVALKEVIMRVIMQIGFLMVVVINV
ncbi:hypothetical protein ACUNFW_18265 [Serratia sp. IR-2025]|uniref:hypothetical protein n=1 Tax=Serratia marcescens TaxID=615 RepID=UPI0013DD312A|nr:hypothetical protein [Serratia marcescens]